jgi:hypothetical protein
MAKAAKTTQLQIRVSRQDKTTIQAAAHRAGMDVSAFVLARVRSTPAEQFRAALVTAPDLQSARFGLARLNTLLTGLTGPEFCDAVAQAPPPGTGNDVLNYAAAMVEHACALRELPVPLWTRAVVPTQHPYFGSRLQSLRLYLLCHSPAAFRRRNIFIDASLGEQV